MGTLQHYREKYKNYQRENTFKGWLLHIKLVLISLLINKDWFCFFKKKPYIRYMQEKESKTNTHFWISLFKSVLRIGACYFLFNEQFGNAAITFGLAEILGIAEEVF